MAKQKKHPWDKWFGRKKFTLKKGRHYTCKTHSMAQQVRNAASAWGRLVSIRILEDQITVTMKE